MSAGRQDEQAKTREALYHGPDSAVDKPADATRSLREGGTSLTLTLRVTDERVTLSMAGLTEDGAHYSDGCADHLLALLPQPTLSTAPAEEAPVEGVEEAPVEEASVEDALTQETLKLLPELMSRPLEAQAWAMNRVLLTAELIAISLDASLLIDDQRSEAAQGGSLNQSSLEDTGGHFLIELKSLGASQRAEKPRLQVSLWVEPLGPRGPKLSPCQGAELSLHQVADERGELSLRGVKRSFNRERSSLEALKAHLALNSAVEPLGPSCFILSFEQGVHLIHELKLLEGERDGVLYTASSDPLYLRSTWPSADEWSITETLDERSLSLQIRKVRGGGMSLSGSIDLGAFGSAKLKEVSQLLIDSPSRYVELSSGVFLSLTEELLHKLQALELSAPEGRATPGSVSVIDELRAAQAQVKASQAWLDSVERMRDASQLSVTLPTGLNATLRTYQSEGYEWMSRLAHWGGGACLADDMGLGKTVQALAVLLSRSGSGPSLVVAPTSVCGAWVDEAARFTPQLRVTRFGIGSVSSPSARRRTLKGLGAGDLMICSYGLLGSEREALCAIEWNTIILDEAQAIKTPSSLRHRAAIELKAAFKVAMTGTPIENHLRDIWSLMRFLNPGLLGDQRRFKQLFEQPIEQGGPLSEQRGEQLKQLVAPFVLRRTKREVLKELPSKTELNLTVTLSSAEAAQYEALRSIAVGEVRERLKEKQAKGSVLPHVFKVLTKLRLACCHPSLVNEGWDGPNAKFDHFKRIITQLRAGGHKALVFSQFVKHLDVLEGWVKGEGITYERLDGSTPAEQRDRSVERFQRGEAELFLISLRAGGVGLTLTEADYVIHMDPWWNPAVEDQATNRAHRIGQDKPVTLYRLITQGTIEERILALHHHKRSLADQVLEGATGDNSVGMDEWLKLLDLNPEGDLLPPEESLGSSDDSLSEWTDDEG